MERGDGLAHDLPLAPPQQLAAGGVHELRDAPGGRHADEVRGVLQHVGQQIAAANRFVQIRHVAERDGDPVRGAARFGGGPLRRRARFDPPHGAVRADPSEPGVASLAVLRRLVGRLHLGEIVRVNSLEEVADREGAEVVRGAAGDQCGAGVADHGAALQVEANHPQLRHLQRHLPQFRRGASLPFQPLTLGAVLDQPPQPHRAAFGAGAREGRPADRPHPPRHAVRPERAVLVLVPAVGVRGGRPLDVRPDRVPVLGVDGVERLLLRGRTGRLAGQAEQLAAAGVPPDFAGVQAEVPGAELRGVQGGAAQRVRLPPLPFQPLPLREVQHEGDAALLVDRRRRPPAWARGARRGAGRPSRKPRSGRSPRPAAAPRRRGRRPPAG